MSEDGFSVSFEESIIEIQIKTLMGSIFDIKVSSNGTVRAIKKKIYRQEGIPVYQQNLIFQSKELKDKTTLCDSGLKNGSILTLVSSMRGGPITTRKLSVTSEHYLLKELKGLFENSREDMSPRSKVSLFVFKKGEIINLLRVTENEDGSYSPYNGNSMSPPAKLEDRDNKLDVFERLVEDTEMSTKLATLRKNMEELNIKKKTRSRNCKEDCCIARQDSRDHKRLESAHHVNDEHYFTYKLLEECAVESLDHLNLAIFENDLFPDEDNQSESEEIALKDKHRTKPKVFESFPVRKTISKHLYGERRGGFPSHSKQNVSKPSKHRESCLAEKIERSPDGYLTFSRNRHFDKDVDNQSGCMVRKSTIYSSNILPNLSISLGNSCVLPSLSNIENEEVNTSLKMKSSQKQFLLESLHSDKLPDLKILDADPFVSREIGDTKQILDSNIDRHPNKTDSSFLNMPVARTIGKSASRFCVGASNDLPNLTNGTSGTYGSFVPDLVSKNSTRVGHRPSNLTTLMNSVPLPSNYYLPSRSRRFRTHSAITPLNTESVSNKQAQISYSRTGLSNIVSESGSSLHASVRNFDTLETIESFTRSGCDGPISGAVAGISLEEMGTKIDKKLQLLEEKSTRGVYGEKISVPPRNMVRLTGLVIESEEPEKSKSSLDSLELEKHTSDLWEIRKPAGNGLNHSGICKVGLLKRHQEVEYNYDRLDNSQSKLKPELMNFSKSPSNFRVCSELANTPQYLAAPSAIPPQYVPTHYPKYCDLFFTDEPISPVYTRRNSREENLEHQGDKCSKSGASLNNDNSDIQRIKDAETSFESREEFKTDNLIGYYNWGCGADILEKAEDFSKVEKLPPVVVKKQSRCNECNKRLKITTIYDCRCGNIFCSQHRYSELHRCTYDYKTEGRKLLERQNPLVTAEKVQRF